MKCKNELQQSPQQPQGSRSFLKSGMGKKNCTRKDQGLIKQKVMGKAIGMTFNNCKTQLVKVLEGFCFRNKLDL